MPTVKLTDKFVKSKTDPGEFWDEVERGLCLRVTAGGAKTWFIRYRALGTQRRFKLGSYPEMSLSEARGEATMAKADVRRGMDPQAEREARRNAAKPKTIKDYLDDYVAGRKVSGIKKWRDEQRAFELHILKRPIGKMPLTEIRKRDVSDLIGEIAKVKPGTAREIQKHLSAFFRWAVEKEMVPISPVEGVKRPVKYQPRDRFLKDDEIKLMWPHLEALGYPFGDWARVLLLTGQRRTEVAQMRWKDIDLEKAVWTIPAGKKEGKTDLANKTKKAHEVPLSPMVIDILKASEKPGGPFVFTTDGETHIQAFSKTKKKIEGVLEGEGIKLEAWAFHDFRRTVATGLGDIGFPPHIAEIVQNRVSGSLGGVVRTYNRAEYQDMKRQALNAWAVHVASLAEAVETSNVISLASVKDER